MLMRMLRQRNISVAARAHERAVAPAGEGARGARRAGNRPRGLALLLALVLMPAAAQASLGGWIYERNRAMEAWMAGLEEHETTVQGVRWVYYARHLERGHCQVLVHGFTAEAANWFRFARHLDRDSCLVVPDLPGYGRSGYSPALGYGMPAQAGRLRDFLGAIGAGGPWHLAGSSMGGHVVLTLAVTHPREVASLALIDAGGILSPAPSDHDRELAAGRRMAFDVRSRADFDAMLDRAMYDPPWMPGLVKDALAQEFIARNARYLSFFPQIYHRDLLDARLGEVAAPTLVLWGARDRLLHVSMASAFGRGIRGARVEILPDAGHLPFLEDPSGTAAIYRRFREGSR